MRWSIPVLAAMERIGRGDPARIPSAIGTAITRQAVDALVAIGIDMEERRSTLVATQSEQLIEHYLNLLSDEDAARRHLGEPQRETVALSTQFAAMQEKLAAFAPEPVRQGPLFSEAADDYIRVKIATHGEASKEVSSLRTHKTAFIAIVGDMRVGMVTKTVMQDFVNRLGWLPPKLDGAVLRDPAALRTRIDENEKAGGPGLAMKTIKDAYLPRVKTIIKHGLETAGLPYTLSTMHFVMPVQSAPPVERRPAPGPAFHCALAYAVENGFHEEALLLCLGRLTGCRIGQLATLTCADLAFDDELDAYVFKPRSHRETVGKKKVRIGHKTQASLNPFVLHEVFESRFVPWAYGRTGPVFPRFMRNVSPEASAQKAIDRVIASASVLTDRRVAEIRRAASLAALKECTFHETRNSRISDYYQIGLPEHAVMLQSGHELKTEHQRYARMEASEAARIRTMSMPAMINWALMDRIDFEAIAKRGSD